MPAWNHSWSLAIKSSKIFRKILKWIVTFTYILGYLWTLLISGSTLVLGEALLAGEEDIYFAGLAIFGILYVYSLIAMLFITFYFLSFHKVWIKKMKSWQQAIFLFPLFLQVGAVILLIIRFRR